MRLRVRTSSLVAQAQRLALACSARNLSHDIGGPSSNAQPASMGSAAWESQGASRCSGRAGRKQHAWPREGSLRSELLEFGYQSRSGIVRLINVELARRAGEGCALWLAAG